MERRQTKVSISMGTEEVKKRFKRKREASFGGKMI